MANEYPHVPTAAGDTYSSRTYFSAVEELRAVEMENTHLSHAVTHFVDLVHQISTENKELVHFNQRLKADLKRCYMNRGTKEFPDQLQMGLLEALRELLGADGEGQGSVDAAKLGSASHSRLDPAHHQAAKKPSLQAFSMSVASSSWENVSPAAAQAPKVEAIPEKKKNGRRIMAVAAPMPVGQILSSQSDEESSSMSLPEAIPSCATPESGLESISGCPTTVIVRNIPARCTLKQLSEIWPAVDNCYNMLYQPFCFKSQRSVGFALVNFVSHAALLDFKARWHGEFLMPASTKAKKLDVVMADFQGLEANLQEMRRQFTVSRIKHMKNHLPIIIKPDGSLADFRALMRAIPEEASQSKSQCGGEVAAWLSCA